MRIVGHRMRLGQAHVERMRIPRRFWDVRADMIPGDVRDDVDGYLRRLDEHLNNGEGLLLWGSNGVGKTSTAVFIALEVRRRGASVLFVTAEGLRQAVLERELFDEGQLLMERAREVDFLVLDDLGKEHPGETGFTERLFENLIRVRSAAQHTTFVTTNLPMTPEGDQPRALVNVYVPSMLEVMKETLYPIRYVGDNLREAVKSDMADRMSATG
jgi:DNA replication protein DnaC